MKIWLTIIAVLVIFTLGVLVGKQDNPAPVNIIKMGVEPK